MTTPAATTTPVTKLSPSANSGRGGREGRGGRGRNSGRGGRGGQQTTSATITAGKAFKGATADMNGHVFQCFNETEVKNQYNRTLEALGGYINKNMKFPADLASLTKTMMVATITPLIEITPAELASPLQKTLWEKSVSVYSNRIGQCERNLSATYAVIWGQFSDTMKLKLKAHVDFAANDLTADCGWILKEIKAIMTRFEGKQSYYLSMNDAYTKFFTHKQGPKVSLIAYLESFQNQLDVLEHYGGKLGTEIAALALCAGPTQAEKIVQSRDENSHKLPSTPKQQPEDTTRNTNPGTTGITLTQNTGMVPGNNGITHNQIKCHSCNQFGHYASNCPSQAVQLLQSGVVGIATGESVWEGIHGFGFHQSHTLRPGPFNDAECQEGHLTSTAKSEHGPENNHDGFIFPKRKGFTFTQMRQPPPMILNTWVLLDSQSTVSVFCNKDFLSNVCQSNIELKVYTNGGIQIFNMVWDIQNFGTVWYNPQLLVNILSFTEVRKKCCIMVDTAVEAAMTVHKQDGSVMKFKEFWSGLYYYDAVDSDNSSPNVTGYVFVNTVAGNKLHFHRREIEAADKAQALQRTIRHPSQKQFEEILSTPSVPKKVSPFLFRTSH